MTITRFPILFILLTFLLCGVITNRILAQEKLPAKTGQKSDFPSGDTFKNARITYRLIPGINNTWGYDILVNGKLTIHQPSVPALPGNEGFRTKENAGKAAKLAIKKMKKGEMPPSIDAEELKKIKAI